MKVSAVRNLSSYEQAVLQKLLQADFIGKESLQRQVANCSVNEIDEIGSLKFHVPSNLRTEEIRKRVPVEAQVKDKDGYYIHYLLHVVNGLVSELEIYKDNSGRISQIPRSEDFEVMVLGN